MKSRRRIAVPARRPRCSAFNFHHQNRKLPAAKRGSVPDVHCGNPERRMSQMGHERRFCDVRVMFATASTAAEKRTLRESHLCHKETRAAATTGVCKKADYSITSSA